MSENKNLWRYCPLWLSDKCNDYVYCGIHEKCKEARELELKKNKQRFSKLKKGERENLVVLEFDQGGLRELKVKDYLEYVKKANREDLEVKLCGVVKCPECTNSIPLDMYIDNIFNVFPHCKDCSRYKEGGGLEK